MRMTICFMTFLNYWRPAFPLIKTIQLIFKVNWLISFYKMAMLVSIGSLVFLNKNTVMLWKAMSQGSNTLDFWTL